MHNTRVTQEMVKNAKEKLRTLFLNEGVFDKQAFVPMDQNGAAAAGGPPQGGGAPQGSPSPQGGPPPGADPAAGGGAPPVGAPGGGGAVQLNMADLQGLMQQMMQQQQAQAGQPAPGGAPGAAPAAGAKKGGKGGDIAELSTKIDTMLDKLNVLLGWFAGMQGRSPEEVIGTTGGGPVEQSLLGGTLGGEGGAPAPMGQPSADPGGEVPTIPGSEGNVDPNSVPGAPPPPGMQVQAAEGERTPAPVAPAPAPIKKAASEGIRLHELIKALQKR